jgi:hypothetical protein
MSKFRVYIQDSELVHGTVDSDSQIKHLINIESDDAEKSIIVEIDHIYEQFKDVIEALNGQTFEVHDDISTELFEQLNIEGHEEFYHLIVE